MFWQQQRYVVLLFYTMFYKIFDIFPPWKQVLLGHKAEEIKGVVVKLPVKIYTSTLKVITQNVSCYILVLFLRIK